MHDVNPEPIKSLEWESFIVTPEFSLVFPARVTIPTPTLVIMRLFHVPSNKHGSLLQHLPVCALLGGRLVVYVPLRLSALHQRVVVEWEFFFGFEKVVTDIACEKEGLAEDWIHYYCYVFLMVIIVTFISIFL